MLEDRELPTVNHGVLGAKWNPMSFDKNQPPNGTRITISLCEHMKRPTSYYLGERLRPCMCHFAKNRNPGSRHGGGTFWSIGTMTLICLAAAFQLSRWGDPYPVLRDGCIGFGTSTSWPIANMAIHHILYSLFCVQTLAASDNSLEYESNDRFGKIEVGLSAFQIRIFHPWVLDDAAKHKDFLPTTRQVTQ